MHVLRDDPNQATLPAQVGHRAWGPCICPLACLRHDGGDDSSRRWFYNLPRDRAHANLSWATTAKWWNVDCCCRCDISDEVTAGHTKRISNAAATWRGCSVSSDVTASCLASIDEWWDSRIASDTDRLVGNRIPPFGVHVNLTIVKNLHLTSLKAIIMKVIQKRKLLYFSHLHKQWTL